MAPHRSKAAISTHGDSASKTSQAHSRNRNNGGDSKTGTNLSQRVWKKPLGTQSKSGVRQGEVWWAWISIDAVLGRAAGFRGVATPVIQAWKNAASARGRAMSVASSQWSRSYISNQQDATASHEPPEGADPHAKYRPCLVLFKLNVGKVLVVAPIASFTKSIMDELPEEPITPLKRHVCYPIPPTPRHVSDFGGSPEIRQHADIPHWSNRSTQAGSNPTPQYLLLGALYKIHLDQNSPSKILGTRHAKGLSVRDDALEAFRAEALRRMSAEELAHFELECMLEDLSEHTGEAMAGVYDEEAQVIMRHYNLSRDLVAEANRRSKAEKAADNLNNLTRKVASFGGWYIPRLLDETIVELKKELDLANRLEEPIVMPETSVLVKGVSSQQKIETERERVARETVSSAQKLATAISAGMAEWQIRSRVEEMLRATKAIIAKAEALPRLKPDKRRRQNSPHHSQAGGTDTSERKPFNSKKSVRGEDLRKTVLNQNYARSQGTSALGPDKAQGSNYQAPLQPFTIPFVPIMGQHPAYPASYIQQHYSQSSSYYHSGMLHPHSYMNVASNQRYYPVQYPMSQSGNPSIYMHTPPDASY